MNPPRPIPYGFAEDANMNILPLIEKYHCSWRQITRWRKELGVSVTRNQSKPVIQYDKDGNEIARYKSMHKAANAVGGCFENISMCANGKLRKAYGFQWRFEDADNIS